MKKVLITLLIIFILIGSAAIILPAIYKDDILKIAKKEINKNVNAEVNFEDVHLSLFRSFPHFSLGIDNLSIKGIGSFEFDTLAYTPRINTTLDLMSVINKDPVQVIAVDINKPLINIKILENGEANYDIVKETASAAKEKETDTASEDVLVKLQKVTINNGHFVYDDASIPYHMELSGINHQLKGDLTETTTLLNTYTEAARVKVAYDNVEYLSDVYAEVDADLKVDFDKMKFTFSDNEIRVNEVPIEAEGWFHMLEDTYDMDIVFQTRRNRFKPFLSLIPAIYKKDFENIQTSGEFAMTGFVRGKYSDDSMPSYHAEIKVNDGTFNYPSLPEKVEEINISLIVDNPTGVTDDVVVNASRFDLTLADNPFKASFKLKTPMSDPYIQSDMDGNIDLASVMRVYPFSPGSDIKGEVDVSLKLEGNLSAIEKENYRDFKALGYVALNNVAYEDSDYDVSVKRGQFNFSPEYVDMTGLELTMGNSDLYANGKLTNILGYVLKDQTLSGDLNVQSQKIDLNELMPESEQVAEEDTESAERSVIQIPSGIEFYMTATINEVLYQKLKLNDVAGKIQIKDRSLVLQNLKMNTMDGMMAMSGIFSTQEDQQPEADFQFDMQQVSVKGVAENFVFIDKLAPVISKARGDVSMNFDYNSYLKNDMMPDLSTVGAAGNMDVAELRLDQPQLLSKLANTLKINELNNAVIKNAGISFEIDHGNLFVKPFDMKLNGMKATLGGRTNLDQTIDYQLQMNIPRNKFGDQANKAVEDLMGEVSNLGIDYKLGDMIPLTAYITGTIKNPKLETRLAKNAADFKKELKDQVNEEIEKKKKEVEEKLKKKADEIIEKARKQGDKLIAEARAQAENLRKKGRQAAEEVRKETDKRVKQIKEKAEGKGVLAKMAAKEAAKQAEKEGYKKADQLENEADRKADSIISEAEKQAEKLINEAKKKADQLE